MELRHLRYFVAAAEEQSVTRAAARLNLAQPPLSRQLRDLEEELGVSLFERGAAFIRLTRHGRLFLKESRAVLRRTEEAVAKVRSAASVDKSELHIGYSPSPTAAFLPAILEAYEKMAPRVRVILHDISSGQMLAGLRADRLHAALRVEHPPSRMPGLRFERLASCRIGVLLPLEHRLSRRSALAINEIQNEPLVVFSRNEYSDYHSWLSRTLRTSGKKLQIALECDGFSSMIVAVVAGAGLAVIGESIMAMTGSRLTFVPLKPSSQIMVVGIAYRESAVAVNPPLRQFIEVARQVAEDH